MSFLRKALVRVLPIATVVCVALGLAATQNAVSSECATGIVSEAISRLTPDATDTLNARMSERYPELKRIVGNPDRFVHDMQGRFEAQKAITPHDPYRFEYFDIAEPALVEMKNQLALKEVEFSHLPQSKEVRIARRYVAELAEEVNRHLSDGRISYRRTNELGFFFGRVAGHFDARKQGIVLKATLLQDSYIQNGFRRFSMQKEYQMFRENDFRVFVGPTPIPDYRRAERPFAAIFSNPHKLEAITLPTPAHLDRDLFFQIMSRKIYPLGVSGEPILADGTLRPAAEFWNHDIRHSSVQFDEVNRYIARHRLTPEAYDRLVHQMDSWYVEFEDEVAKIPDEKLRRGVWLVVFNIHHERGFPFVPSAYTSLRTSYHAKLLYGVMKLNGEIPKGVSFNVQAAYKWLLEFWEPKRELEQALEGVSF